MKSYNIGMWLVRTTGLQDYGTTGLRDYGTAGPADGNGKDGCSREDAKNAKENRGIRGIRGNAKRRS
jgi:hypothetical protein